MANSESREGKLSRASCYHITRSKGGPVYTDALCAQQICAYLNFKLELETPQ